MKTPAVALNYGGGSGSDEDDDEEDYEEVPVPSSDDEGVTKTKQEEEEEKGASVGEDVGQRQRLLASQKLAFVERVFMTTTASSS